MATKTDEIKEMLPEAEAVLQNEDSLLQGLLDAANWKDESDSHKLVQIIRGEGDKKKLYFEFTIKPLAEDEIQRCRRKCTKYVENPYNKKIKEEGETDYVKLRSLKIYQATIETDRAKIWDNKKIKEQLDVITAEDVIDKVLLAGEKSALSDLIDKISGYDVSLEDVAKN